MASNPKVSILDYFNIVFEGENGKIESNCKACGTRIQAKRSVTSNFVTHLKRKHHTMYDEFVKKKDMKRESYSSASVHSLSTNGGARFPHAFTAGGGGAGGAGGGGAKFDRHDPRQLLVSEAIAKMVVRDLQAASVVEKAGFRDLLLLLEPRYTPDPPRYLQMQLLPAYAYQAQLATRQALASAHALSLSLDLWRGLPGAGAGANTGYLGVTCHFLTSDWLMRSALLACLPLVGGGGGSANRVLAEFEDVCHAHGVSGRAFRVVADSSPSPPRPGSPARLPGFRIHGDAEEEEEDSGDEEAGPGEEEGAGPGNGESEGGGGGEGGGGEGGGGGEDWWEGGLGGSRVDCFSRQLSVCVREGLRCCPLLAAPLAKAAAFYNYVCSAVPADKLSQAMGGPGGGAGVPSTAERDWAAQLKVLRRLLDSADFLEDVSDRGELALSGQERALLRELADTLEPFAEAWEMVHGGGGGGDRHVSVSLALPCVLGLQKHLSEASAPRLPCLLAGLARALDRRLAPILGDPLYVAATSLDPQFKLSWSPDPDWHRQVLLEEVSRHALPACSPQGAVGPSTELLHPQDHQASSAGAPAPVSASSVSRPCPKLFSFIKQRPTAQAKSLEQELAAYLREEPTDEDPLHYWRRKAIDFPQLAVAARRALTVPAGGSAVDAIFSGAGRSLGAGGGPPKNLETLIYLKANYRLLWT